MKAGVGFTGAEKLRRYSGPRCQDTLQLVFLSLRACVQVTTQKSADVPIQSVTTPEKNHFCMWYNEMQRSTGWETTFFTPPEVCCEGRLPLSSPRTVQTGNKIRDSLQFIEISVCITLDVSPACFRVQNNKKNSAKSDLAYLKKNNKNKRIYVLVQALRRSRCLETVQLKEPRPKQSAFLLTNESQLALGKGCIVIIVSTFIGHGFCVKYSFR